MKKKRKRSPPSLVSPVAKAGVERRDRKRTQSREEILEATRRVMLREGVARTTLDAVADEMGLTKAALYYYYPSKNALLFELIFRIVEADAHAVHDAVESTSSGREALRAIIRTTVTRYAAHLEDFRLVYLHAQVAGPGAMQTGPEDSKRLRPLNDLAYGGATRRLDHDRGLGGADVAPRRLAFLAHMAAIGFVTMKGMVENAGDPLLYRDEELIEDLARIFENAAGG